MQRIIYVSRAAENLGSPDLFKIIETSAANNADRDLTGFLLYSGGAFFQYLEGPGDAIDRLIETLRHDPRHHSLEIVLREPAESRLFPKWRMKRIAPGDIAASRSTELTELGGAPAHVRQKVEGFLSERKAAA